jgi:coenzyme F420-0:L-glutamate ligase
MIHLIPIKIKKKKEMFDLPHVITSTGFIFNENDIIIVSSKFVSISEGSLLDLSNVKVSLEAKNLAEKYYMDPRVVEMVIRDSDIIFGGLPGFLLAIKNGVLAPNAGIDKSNVPENFIICLPHNAFYSAEKIRLHFLLEYGLKIGVVISDSRLMPTRIGTVGVAVGCAGIEPVEDLRGHKDLYGNIMKYTLKANADSLATMGTFVMGESDESVPVVVVRGAKIPLTDRKLTWKDLAIEYNDDIYLRGMNLMNQ